MTTTPKAIARITIDAALARAGWVVQDRPALNLYAARGVAVREFPLPGFGAADYLLFADGEPVGAVEAKPVGYTLTAVEVGRRLSVVDELEATVAPDLKRAERLRQAILRRAFAGELVPQDPNDEPASALLARIKGERQQQPIAGPQRRRTDRCE